MAEACTSSLSSSSPIIIEVGDDTSSVYASENNHILITGHTSSIRQWEIDKTTDTYSSKSFELDLSPDDDVTCICTVDSTTIAVSIDRSVLFFDVDNLSKPSRSLSNCSQEEINHLAVNRKGEFLSVCDDSGEILIIEISTGKKFKTCRKHDNICSVALFNPRRNWELVSGGLDCCIINWDYSKGKPLSSVDMTTVSTPSPSGYSINPPMVHTLCLLGSDCPLMAAGLGNGCIALINPNRRGQIDIVSMVTTHSSSVNTLCYINEISHAPFNEKSKQVLVSGGNDTKLIVSTLTSAQPRDRNEQSKKSHITGIEGSKVIDHGSKINSCVYRESTGELIVSDLTTNISIYDTSKFII